MGSRRVVELGDANDRLPLKELGVAKGRPVIAFAGTTSALDPQLAARLYPFIRTVVATAADHGAIVVTGGTDAGVIRLLGLSLGSLSDPPALVGVAPRALVARDGEFTNPDGAAADPNHDALLLVPGERWGDETPVLSRLVSTIADRQPSLLVVVGGGAGAYAEFVEHVRAKRPVVVLGRSGRLADELAAQSLAAKEAEAPTPSIAVRQLHVIDLAAESPARLREVLSLLLSSSRQSSLRSRFPLLSVWPRLRRPHSTPTLPFDPDAGQIYAHLRDVIVEGHREVYPSYAEYDQAAVREQQRYRLFVVAAMFGGFLTTVFGAVQAAWPTTWWPGVVVATVGASTTALTTVARRQGALDVYLRARIRAERLRSLFVSFVASAPGAGDDERARRVRKLQEDVANIRFGRPKR